MCPACSYFLAVEEMTGEGGERPSADLPFVAALAQVASGLAPHENLCPEHRDIYVRLVSATRESLATRARAAQGGLPS